MHVVLRHLRGQGLLLLLQRRAQAPQVRVLVVAGDCADVLGGGRREGRAAARRGGDSARTLRRGRMRGTDGKRGTWWREKLTRGRVDHSALRPRARGGLRRVSGGGYGAGGEGSSL